MLGRFFKDPSTIKLFILWISPRNIKNIPEYKKFYQLKDFFNMYIYIYIYIRFPSVCPRTVHFQPLIFLTDNIQLIITLFNQIMTHIFKIRKIK